MLRYLLDTNICMYVIMVSTDIENCTTSDTEK